MLEPDRCIGICVEKLPGAEVFYDLRHQTIYGTMIAMFDAREPIDTITLYQKLKDENMSEEVGGLAYLSTLPDTVPSAENIESYLETVREKYVLRRMIRTCTDVISKAYESEGEVESLLDTSERDFLKIGEMMGQKGMPTIKQLVRESISDIEAVLARKGEVSGIKTGFQDFDRMTDGLHPGDMVVIAARPSMGKTSLAMNIVENVAIDQGLPVGVFSLEMTGRSLVTRMLLSRARVNSRTLADGILAERDFPKLTNAAGKIGGSKIQVDDSSGLSIYQLRAKARRMWQQHGIKLFVIDYLQLLNAQGSRKKYESRQLEITDISSGIKALAKELQVPVIILSQLNRELEKDKARRPRLADLRESGSIEQDADLVAMLYKPSGGSDVDFDPSMEAFPVNLLIAKQRNGPIGDVHLTFLKTLTRFESAAKVSEEDVPQ